MPPTYIYVACAKMLKIENLLDMQLLLQFIYNKYSHSGGAHGVMVIIIGNGHGDTSSNLRQDWLHFT